VLYRLKRDKNNDKGEIMIIGRGAMLYRWV
jgi:hypothetical protein